MASRFTWPMAVGDTSYAKLPIALIATARLHSQRAIDNLGSTRPLDLLDQATSIGVAAELLLKAVLAAVDFGLLRGRNADFKTTLTLAGKPFDPERRLPDMKTVGAVEASALLKQLAPGRRLLGDDVLARLLAVRDSAVHMGFACPNENESALADLVRLIEISAKVAAELGHADAWDSFWSAEYRERAEEILRSRDDDIAIAFHRALSVARNTFTARWQLPGNAAMIHVLEQMEPFALTIEDDETTRPHTCPACGSQGRVLYRIARGPVQVDNSDFPHSIAYYVETLGVPAVFHCNICDLTLDSAEDLELAQVNDIDLGEEEASETEVDAAFGRLDDDPREDWWSDHPEDGEND